MHPDRRWGEGVGGRKEECTPELPVFVRCFGWSSDDVVPSKGEVLISFSLEDFLGRYVSEKGRGLTQGYWSRMGGRLCMEEDFAGWLGTRVLTGRN